MIMHLCLYKVKCGMMERMIGEIRAERIEQRFRKQPGCVLCQFSVAAKDKNTVYLTNIWADEASFQAYLTCEVIPPWHAIKDRYIISKQINRFDFE